MRRKSSLSFGPGAASLILIVVILALSVLGMLALMNARSDSRLSHRSVEVIAAGYELSAQAERSLAALDEVALKCRASSATYEDYLAALQRNLPQGMQAFDDEIYWSESDGYRTLDCTVKVMPLDSERRFTWREHYLTAITEDTWN